MRQWARYNLQFAGVRWHGAVLRCCARVAVLYEVWLTLASIGDVGAALIPTKFISKLDADSRRACFGETLPLPPPLPPPFTAFAFLTNGSSCCCKNRAAS
jgi:hypothetical protein